MALTVDGYAEVRLVLQAREIQADVWVSLEEGVLVDWGDGYDRQTGQPIPWQQILEELAAEGLSFETEFSREIRLQAEVTGLSAEPARLAGPGLAKATIHPEAPQRKLA